MLLRSPLRPLLTGLALACCWGCSPRETAIEKPAPSPDDRVAPAIPRPIDRYENLVLTAPTIPTALSVSLKQLNAELSHGVQPNENAAVWLLQAMSDSAIDEAVRPFYLQLLGIERLSDTVGRMPSVEEFVEAVSTPEDREEGITGLKRLLETYDKQPWKREDHPYLAAYIDGVEDPLQTVIDASRKPRMFVPIVSLTEPMSILGSWLPLEQSLGTFGRALATRSMLRAAGGERAAALDDINALHRLARLTSNGGSLIQHQAAYGLASMAYYAEVQCIINEGLDKETAERQLRTLRELVPYRLPGHSVRLGERAALQEGLTAIEEGRWSSLDITTPVPAEKMAFFMTVLLRHPMIRWDVVRTSAHREFDEVWVALDVPDRKERQARLSSLKQTMDDWMKTSPSRMTRLPLTLWIQAESDSRFLGQAVAYFAMPAFKVARDGYDRAVTRAFMAEVGLALTIHRHEHGEFPNHLSELAPKFFPTEPLDPCTDKPLTYHKSGPRACRVYSWGTNGTDDDGQGFNREQTTDDFQLEFKETTDSPTPEPTD